MAAKPDTAVRYRVLPPERAAREMEEELQLQIVPEAILDSWVYTIVPGVSVLVIAYGCIESSTNEAVLSDEHTELRWFPLGEVDTLRLPEGYKASIRSWSHNYGAGLSPK